MGSSKCFKLCLCFVSLAVARCASEPDRKVDELVKTNDELRRRVSEQESEVKRLESFLEPSEALEDDLAIVDIPKEEDRQVPLTVLKPPPVVGEEEDVLEESRREKQTVANSAHEAMTWYQQGLQMLQNRNFDGAVRAFTVFLRMEPEHVYADRAQFWIAESHFLNREYALAVVADNLLVSRYPHSVRVPDSLYRAALSHLAMGQKRPARGLLRELLSQFPGQEISITASRKLAEISKGYSSEAKL